MTSVNVTELRQHLPEYLKQVQRGEEVVITLHGKTIARIVPDRPDCLSVSAQKYLDEGIAAVELAYAAISLWEIAVLFRKKRLVLPAGIHRFRTWKISSRRWG